MITNHNWDWTVRVYDGDTLINTWRIDNRTEHEANREAAADVRYIHGEDVDWSMMATKDMP